jgi:hypothetical protein
MSREACFYHACLLNSACVRSRTNVPFWFLDGSISLTDGLLVEEGLRTLATVGNGRSPREGGNVIFRRGSTRGAEAARFDCEVSASGEETAGRETVTVAVFRVSAMNRQEKRSSQAYPSFFKGLGVERWARTLVCADGCQIARLPK